MTLGGRWRGRTVAPVWATWVLIVLGALEIPWVIWLALFQDPVVHARHVRLTMMGLVLAALALCLISAWGVWRERRWAPIATVAAATVISFSATVAALSPGVRPQRLLGSGVHPMLLAAPVIAAAAWSAWSLLQREPARLPGQVAHKVAAVVLLLATIPLVYRLGNAASIPHTSVFTQARALVVALDTAEVVGLLGAGLSSLRGRPPATLVLATMGGTLLTCDAWVNVMTTSGEAFRQALFYLVVGEIPSILVCVVAAIWAYRKLPTRLRARAA